MKKSSRILGAVMSAVMIMSAVPAVSASAASKTTVGKPTVKVENVTKGVKVSWSKAKKAKKYVVLRKVKGAKKYTTIKTAKTSKAGSFVDKKAKSGKTYQYKVKAVNGNKSAISSAKKMMRLTSPTVSVDAGIGIIDVSVGKKSKGAKVYEIYRANVKNGKTGKYRKVDTVSGDEYDMYESEESNVNAKFKARAVNGKYKSAFSKIVKLDYVAEPLASSAINADYTGIDITWEAIKNVDGFRIYRSENGGKFKLLKDIKLKDCVKLDENDEYNMDMYIYTDKDVVDGKKYSYEIEAYDGKRKSKRSEVFFEVDYKDAAATIKVGETSDVVVESIALMDAILSIADVKGEYTVVSENTEVVTVDEENIVHGVAPGKAIVKLTLTATVEGETVSETAIIPIKVVE